MKNKGEVWFINLDPAIGDEIKKTRPCVIVNSDEVGVLSLKIVVPLTRWKEKYSDTSWMVPVKPDSQNGLDKPSSADCFQIKSVDESRFLRKIGNLDDATMSWISDALAVVLDIES